MKDSILPQVAKAGGLKNVEFAYVDIDQEPKLAGRLARANAIPQMIRFEKTEKGWGTDLLTGARSVGQVASFINPEDQQDKRESPESWIAALINWARSVAGMN
jgi:thioredoxin-like negative regulator of GroEL